MAESSISFHKVLSEAKRIINLNRRHFFSLSALFLFPLSLLSLLYLSIIQNKQIPNPIPYFNIVFSLISNILSLFSVSTIIYSTYHAYHGEQVDLLTTLRSIRHSFWPLVSTFMVNFVIFFLMTIPMLLSMLVLYQWLHGTSYLTPCLILFGVVSVLGLIRLTLTWMLSSAVVVVESKWGYAPLKRSASLMKGNKRVAFSILLYFQLAMGLMYWFFYSNRLQWSRDGNTADLCIFALMIMLGSIFVSQIALAGYVSMTVLYIYCIETSQEGLPILCSNPDKLVHLLK